MTVLDERFRSLVACADDTIVMTDSKANIVFINEAGKRLIGADSEDLVGVNAFDLIARESRADAADGLRRVLAEGVARGVEFLVCRRDGTKVPIEMTASVMRDAGGAPVGYMSILRDISARRREQDKSTALLDIARAISGSLELWEILERVQKRASEALACDTVATFCWDKDRSAFRVAGHYTHTGDKLFRASTFEFQRGVPFVDRLATVRTVLINDVNAQDWVPAELLQPLGITALLWTQLIVQGRPIGALVALHMRPAAQFDGDHVVLFEGIAQQLALGMEAVQQYSTSQREVASSAALARELDIANRTKSDFVAAIAHELRSPLSVITGYSSLLLDGAFGALAEEQVDVVERIDRTTATLAELVNTLLDFSRLESGQLGIEAEDIDVASLLAAVDDETRDLRGHNPNVVFEVGADAGLRLRTDPLKLKVVLKNLIGNALKFTERGRVGLDARSVEGGVEIRVSDTGVGIPPEAVAVIFDPFRQLAGIKSRSGFGLGLYIVRRLLDLLGGTIGVESEAGRGTTFAVFLPEKAGAGD